MSRREACVVAWVLSWLAGSATGEAPTLEPAKDAEHFGRPGQILFWNPKEQVAGYRNIDKILPTREVDASGTAYPLLEKKQDLGAVTIRSRDTTMTVNEYFTRQSVAGLLVIKDGHIVYERYGLGNTADHRWISFSITKSVVSMLVGAAIQDGYIKSLDERVTDYLPRLKGSPYDDVTIRQLLQMASGVQWDEDYADPNSDVNRAAWSTLGLYDYLRRKPRAAEAGSTFNYNTAETNLVGTLLRSAIGNNLSTYLEDKIWRPFGMETEATWMLSEAGGGETGGCCLSATLRDYGRLGLFALAGGRLADGTRVLPADWMTQSTTPSKAYRGYGYLWWLDSADAFEATGIFGQGIYINRRAKVVIALHSARPTASASSDWALQGALFEALTAAIE